MNVLVVSGIWPPDVGGPASHAPALAAHLHAAGHGVDVVTTADGPPATAAYAVRWVSRRLPPGLRHVAAVLLITRRARSSDVVYATSMVRRAALASLLARRPLVVKLVADEAYERAMRHGLFRGTLAEFQSRRGGVRLRALRATRSRALRHAALVLSPSAYLRDVALGWGLEPSRVRVVPNPAPEVAGLEPRASSGNRLDMDGVVLAFAGRLTAQKDLGAAVAAVADAPGVSLRILGDGPERERLEREVSARGLGDRVAFLGPGSRDDVLRLFAEADGVVLASAWENMPHTVLEALAVGTPVIATAVGGVPEVVRDGQNGLLVPPGSPEALSAAIRRFAGDAELRARLAASASASVADLAEGELLDRIESLLAEVVAR